MAANLRYNKKEEELLRKKCVEINKVLVAKEKQPLRDSELAHFVLENAIPYVKITKSGKLVIEC